MPGPQTETDDLLEPGPSLANSAWPLAWPTLGDVPSLTTNPTERDGPIAEVPAVASNGLAASFVLDDRQHRPQLRRPAIA